MDPANNAVSTFTGATSARQKRGTSTCRILLLKKATEHYERAERPGLSETTFRLVWSGHKVCDTCDLTAESRRCQAFLTRRPGGRLQTPTVTAE